MNPYDKGAGKRPRLHSLVAAVTAAATALLLGLPALWAPPAAFAAVTVTRAELRQGELRVEGEGAAPRASITVDGVARGAADDQGRFRVEAENFTSPTCRVTVSDGVTTAQPILSGCTPSAGATPSPTTPPAVQPTATPQPTAVPQPTATPQAAGSAQPTPATTPLAPTPTSAGLRIVDGTLPPGNVGTDYAAFIMACCGSGGSGEPYRWRLVAGRVPDGLSFAGDSLRLTRSTGVLGRPRTVQTTSFTVEVRDGSGATARKTFSITINPARPLVITNQSDALAPAEVGVAYAIGVFADGGVPPYRWSLAAGQLPPGLSLTTSPGRITGTPTAVGTFAFTLRVTDDEGQSATRQFSITVA